MITIVGNSSSVLGRGLGETIDASDIIVRCNSYRLDGYSTDVGRDTTHWAFGVCGALVESLEDHPGLSTPAESWPVGINGKAAERGDDWDAIRRLVKMGRVVDLTYASLRSGIQADLNAYHLIGRHIQPTTGFMAVARAVGLAHEPVGVCGMNGIDGHYWKQTPGLGVSNRHSLSHEGALLDRWESHGLVIRLDR